MGKEWEERLRGATADCPSVPQYPGPSASGDSQTQGHLEQARPSAFRNMETTGQTAFVAGWLFPPSSRKLSNLELKPQTTDRARWGEIFPLSYGLQFRVRESGQTSE